MKSCAEPENVSAVNEWERREIILKICTRPPSVLSACASACGSSLRHLPLGGDGVQRAVDAAQHRGATCDGVLDEIDPDGWGQKIGIF